MHIPQTSLLGLPSNFQTLITDCPACHRSSCVLQSAWLSDAAIGCIRRPTFFLRVGTRFRKPASPLEIERHFRIRRHPLYPISSAASSKASTMKIIRFKFNELLKLKKKNSTITCCKNLIVVLTLKQAPDQNCVQEKR